MSTDQNEESKIDESCSVASDNERQKNPRHLHIIAMLGEAKGAARNTTDVPCVSICPLMRARAVGTIAHSPSVYMIKKSGEIIFDKGDHDDLNQNPRLLKLGKDPLTHMPMTANQRLSFKEELRTASHAFFQRTRARQMLQESKINNEVTHALKS